MDWAAISPKNSAISASQFKINPLKFCLLHFAF
jgi:hypothetical protein